ncbi:MAG: phage tail protein [Roseivivax sp.]|nr:phage tail protein [Roseivivax sp.]
MLPTFTPPVPPSPGTERHPQVDLRDPPGDLGLSLAAPAGLNHIRRVITLRWDALTLVQAQALGTFFTERAGHLPFWYQPHGYRQPVRWTCREWAATMTAPAGFRAVLRQNFTHET